MLKHFLALALLIAAVSALTLKSDLQTELKKNGQADIFMIFNDEVNFKQLELAVNAKLDTMDHSRRGHLVVDSLKAVAKESQKNVIAYLKKNFVKFTSHWISNTIVIKEASMPLMTTLSAQFTEIKSFELVSHVDKIESVPEARAPTKQKIEAGVQWVKAPEVWAQGHTGKGIVVGVIDTGAFLHDDLKDGYRGRDGNHDYNWLDATRANRPEPYDDHFHGTHCHGTITGNSTTETVGVAPGAEWISCKFLTGSGGGSFADLVKCLEWMLAPTTVDGKNANSDKRPHLVSNSYGGGSPSTAIERALDALLAAGVEMVFAAGNSGSRCSTVGMPGSYPQAYAVGSINRNSNTISSFSSRGPGQQRSLKPDISAPGANVRSTDNRNGYRSVSGTSMACPHVAGVIALLWSAKPELSRNIAATRKILNQSALGQESRLCSSTSASPNNVYGYGTINAEKALEAAKKL